MTLEANEPAMLPAGGAAATSIHGTAEEGVKIWQLPLGLQYSSFALKRDLLAGLTVAAISLPQAMAYALLAGVDPRFGLYSAIVVTLVASIFGSSAHLINGPTSAISLVVFSALAYFGPDQRVEAAEGMFLLGAMVGIIQILIAVFKLGDLTRYISEAVILGFLSSAAVLLAVGQVASALGVHDKGTGAQHVLYRLWLTLTEGDPINVKAVTITASTLVLAILSRNVVRRYRLPQFDMLAVLIVMAIVAYFAGWTLPGPTGKTAIAIAGTVPRGLPTPHIPDIHLMWIRDLAPDALAIAFLGLLEALAIAKSIASETKQSLDFNRQCLAEGLANLTGSFFRCLPGSGSLTRSAINFHAGAITRFSGIIAAVAVAIAVLALAPFARFVPKPALAALLLLTASRLIDPKRIAYTLRASRQDAMVLILTVLSAFAFGLDAAIMVGVGLSVILFIPRAAKLRVVELVVGSKGAVRERFSSDPATSGFIIYDLEGELFFGAAPELERCLGNIRDRIASDGLRYVVLRVSRVRNPDVVGLESLAHFLHVTEEAGAQVLLAGVKPDLLEALSRLHFSKWLPADRVFEQRSDDDSATLAAIRSVYDRLGHEEPEAHRVREQADFPREFYKQA
jgi:SulP family sulfate permease